MSSPEQLQNQNETYKPSEGIKALQDMPSFDKHMQKVKAKREFQEKYGDHPDSRVLENVNEYIPPEDFVKNPDLKPRTGYEQDHPISIEEPQDDAGNNPFRDISGSSPDGYI